MNDKPHPNGLRFGAVAFLDALGFKGIWSRYAPRDVIHNLRGVTFGDPMYQDPPLDLERCSLASSVVTLSDTIVVSAAVTAKFASIDVTTDLECQVVALASVCSKAGTICSMILNSNTPLVYRAAVAVGEFVHDDRFLMGPAIDEAAEQEKHAAGGLVWLTASAAKVVYEARREGLFGDLELFLVSDYPVPMKDGDHLASVVNPLRFDFNHDRFLERVEATFTDCREDVQRKRTNTMAFLRHARGALVPV